MDSQLQSSGKEPPADKPAEASQPPADKPAEAPQPPAEPTHVEVSAPALCSSIKSF